MSKELNIIEAMNMPIGTKFEIFFKNGGKLEQKFKLSEFAGLTKFKWEDDKNYVEITKDIVNAKFIPIQKPVSFMEAVKAFSKGKVIECELNGEKFIYGDEYKNQLMDSDELAVGPNEILNGKWYIEEE